MLVPSARLREHRLGMRRLKFVERMIDDLAAGRATEERTALPSVDIRIQSPP
jgi:hypothetical protein